MAVVFQRKAGSINLMERAEQQHESRQTGTVQSWECALTFCIALPLVISLLDTLPVKLNPLHTNSY